MTFVSYYTSNIWYVYAMESTVKIQNNTVCYHCGEGVLVSNIVIDDKQFCCNGCKTVYEIINGNNLCNYYAIEKTPGINQRKDIRKGKYDFLDDVEIIKKLTHFSNETQQHVTFYLPQMHCSSCIWILEQLNKIDAGIIKSQVNFIKKEVTVVYNYHETSLKKVAETLAIIGYEPHISLNNVSESKIKTHTTTTIVKIGIAGFCFGNIMMLSFPEYFSMSAIENPDLKQWFSYLILALSLPVFFYAGTEFFVSGYKGLRQKTLNIDAPIALAIFITFARSVYEIITHTGVGYLDSMSGIVFFMLVGRYFQNRTYQSISFDRDFTSYFPLGVSVLSNDGTEKQLSVAELKVGNRIKIHNNEIIPADALLFMGKATIDYSFVTGESTPVEKTIGEIIYAGGKQTAGAIELEVVKEVSQSYLTQLWNNEIFDQDKQVNKPSFIKQVSNYFSCVLFLIAIISGLYWAMVDSGKMWNAITSVLIVACPCALLLSATFTNGNMMRILNKYKFYIKNASVIERLSNITTIVFDKTGTLTTQGMAQVLYTGATFTNEQAQIISLLAQQSNHPLSKTIVAYLPPCTKLIVKHYQEIKGSGACGSINNQLVKLGVLHYVAPQAIATKPHEGSIVHVSINNEVIGYFTINNSYRSGLKQTIQDLQNNFELKILSGDNALEEKQLKTIFDKKTEMLFNQTPEDKLNYIKHLQANNKQVVMIGDGLNDAGALRQSNVGIAISDDTNNFSPACDAILAGQNFNKLMALITYCKKQKIIIYASFIVSIMYNVIGLYFATQGTLQPVIAAILMPLSSISIVLLTTSLSAYYELKLKNQ